ncbi:MAG: ROK family transcriptional regulator [Eubacteriales bacterium]|nr:ROK family transcriptional regulator [Eubacteriales bacterium]
MKLGLNNESMQRANRNLILGILMESKGISRVELAKRTNLQRATITNIINQFLEAGVVREEDSPRGAVGRKAGLLYVDVPHAVVLSARITREFFDAQAFSLAGKVLAHRHTVIDKDSRIEDIVSAVYHELDQLTEQFGERNVLGMCVGLPGPYIRNNRNVAIVTGFEQLGKIDLQCALEQRYPFLVVTEHDAKLSAFAEWESLEPENQAKEDCLIAIQSIGIGIGSGMIIKGRIFSGAVGVAGEIGHMGINFTGSKREGGNRGTFESYASTGVTKNYVLERLYEFPSSPLNENSSFEDIVTAAEAGDALAITALDKLAWMLGYGLVNMVFVLNPNRIILSDAYPNNERFLQKVNDSLREMVYPEMLESLKILHSVINMDSTVLGGYYLVIENLLKTNLLMDRITSIESQYVD